MWNTTYKYNEQNQIVEATHHFGQQVTLITDFKTNMATQMHGDILFNEFPINPALGIYTNFLNDLDNEVNPTLKKQEE